MSPAGTDMAAYTSFLVQAARQNPIFSLIWLCKLLDHARSDEFDGALGIAGDLQIMLDLLYRGMPMRFLEACEVLTANPKADEATSTVLWNMIGSTGVLDDIWLDTPNQLPDALTPPSYAIGYEDETAVHTMIDMLPMVCAPEDEELLEKYSNAVHGWDEEPRFADDEEEELARELASAYLETDGDLVMYQIIQALHASLIAQPEKEWQCAGWSLAYPFRCCSEDCFNIDAIENGAEPLDWKDLSLYIHQKDLVERTIPLIDAGWSVLDKNIVRQAIRDNATKLYACKATKPEDLYDYARTLTWPRI